MGAGKAVNANVIVADPVTGAPVFVEKGEVPPDDVVNLLGEHLFVEQEEAGSEIPPQSGRGSGRDAWAAYAEGKVDVTDDMSRDDIVDALRDARVPVGDVDE